MRKIFFSFFVLLSCLGFAQEEYLGVYIQGQKIGYQASARFDDIYNSKKATRTESTVVFDLGMLGQQMKMVMQTVSWLDAKGKPLRIKSKSESQGRIQTVDAVFKLDKIEVQIDNSGTKTTKTLQIPKGATVVDDAVNALMQKGPAAGATGSFYVLDTSTVSLAKNTVTMKGRKKVTVGGKEVDATWIKVSDTRADTNIYLSAKGDFIKAETIMGMEMLPITKEEALAKTEGVPPIDFAFVSAIKPNKELPDKSEIKSLKLKIVGQEVAKVPSDAHQTVTKGNGSWVVTMHPTSFAKKQKTIATAAAEKKAWIAKDLNMPTASERFKTLAKTVVGDATTPETAAKRVYSYVHNLMRPNAGIGVLRDAGEVLDTKEGVCRDYAILTGTLLRAANVPTKLVSGLVLAEGQFFYHAWVEVWDGTNWVGIDSTLPDGQVTAGHIKLAEGSVEQAYSFTFLDKVRMEVLNVERR